MCIYVFSVDTDSWDTVSGKLEYISAGFAGVWGTDSGE